MSKYFLIRKIPLEKLLHNLKEMYENGLDFIDVGVTIEDNEPLDVLDLIGRDEYMAPEENDRVNFDDDLDEII